MTSFCSFAGLLKELISRIICSDDRHAKWLNTLSYLENCGARKIAACEHPTNVKQEMLKHAAEEFRHAHYLKSQIAKMGLVLKDYALPNLMGGVASLHYLSALDIQISRYLSKEEKLSEKAVREAAYLLVTYAIELRAEELYPLYEEALRKGDSKVRVKSILLEEKEHLNEMRDALDQFPFGWQYAKHVCLIEGDLCKKWLGAIQAEIV